MYLALPLPGMGLDVFSVHSFPRQVSETSSFMQTKISASYLFQNPGTCLWRWIPWIAATQFGLACFCVLHLLDFSAGGT